MFPTHPSGPVSPTLTQPKRLWTAVVEALGRPRSDGALAADDPGLFRRLLPVALGSEVDEEFVPLLLEQGGFQLSQPTLPRTVPIPKTMTVAIVGAGLAGIITALAAADAGVTYEIFDRNSEVGGTWLTTTYPGIGVDTPSAYYSLSREVNPNWTSYYPQGAEYQAYLVALADKYGLRERTRFGTEVEALWWDEDRGQWQIHSVGRRRQSRRHLRLASWSPPPATSTGRDGQRSRAGKPLRASVFTPRSGMRPWTSPASGWRSSERVARRFRSSTPASTRSHS